MCIQIYMEPFISEDTKSFRNMDFFEQEMELFHPFPFLRSKNFVRNIIFVRSRDYTKQKMEFFEQEMELFPTTFRYQLH